MAGVGVSDWDPTIEPDFEPSKEATEAILTEINMWKDEPYVKVYFDEDNISKVDVLIIGQPDTPYEGGFFYFLFRYPPDYPQRPPKVKLMNTGGGGVRFNPNIYATGMVCHPILGTYKEATWGRDNNNKLSDVLETIVCMLHKTPYINEPVNDRPCQEFQKGDIERYNDVIRHETLRVAVCEMLEGTVEIPEAMREEITRRFQVNYAHYAKMCDVNKNKDGNAIKDSDPFFNVEQEMNDEELKILTTILVDFLKLVPISRTLALLPLALLHMLLRALGCLNRMDGLLKKGLNFNAAREGNFDYTNILRRLNKIKSDLDHVKQQEPETRADQ